MQVVKIIVQEPVLYLQCHFRGATKTLGNFAKATFAAISETYHYLTPDMWKETQFTKGPYQEFTDFLAKNHISGQKAQPKEAQPPVKSF